jgi:hypothetical protein
MCCLTSLNVHLGGHDSEVYKPLEASVSKAAINAAAERNKRRERESNKDSGNTL